MRFLVLIGAIALLSACTAQPNTVAPSPKESAAAITMAKYDQIKNGMTQAEVEKILGNGEELSSSEIGEVKTTLIQWNADNFGGNMNVTFQDGKVVAKAQFGLK